MSDQHKMINNEDIDILLLYINSWIFLSVCFFCESKYRYKDTCLILEANHEVTDKYVKDQMKK